MDLVTVAMGFLPFKLLMLLKEEYKLQKGVREDVKYLSLELESMYAALRKVATVPWEQLDDQIKVWAWEVKEASYDLEDVLDSFIIRVRGNPDPAKTDDLVKRLLKKMGRLFNLRKMKTRRDFAGTIIVIKKQVQEMSERRDRYRINDIVVRPSTATENVDPRLSALYTEASQLVGIEDPRDEVIKMLSIGECGVQDNKEMRIVSVVGFGGLGKTTLAKAVYDKVHLRFDCWAFVSVGQNPDPRKVLRDILNDINENKKKSIIFEQDNRTSGLIDFMELDERQLIDNLRIYLEGRRAGSIIFEQDNRTSGLIDFMKLDERQLIDKLRIYLEGKRYLIVADDIWETSTWGIIKNAFVDRNCGSRVITTTRNCYVSMASSEVYKIAELSDMNSKKLFYTKIFGQGEKHISTPELDEVSDKIIQKCRGVPLAIVTIASVLAHKPPEDWSNVYNAIGFGPDEDTHVQNMKKILSFSYYDLPCYLRTCLLYLSVFPKVYDIEKRDLILRWIAEGFVQEEEGKGFSETGDRYINELINRSLIIPIEEKGSGLLSGCRIHDMVLHIIRDLSNKENFALVFDGDQQPPVKGSIRRLTLQMTTEETNYKDLTHVRSFSVTIGDTALIPPVCSFKVLRVLVLEYCINMEGYSLQHVAKLIHLRYLSLSHTPARKLPKEIGRLKFLQTLLLDDSGIEELPMSVRQLTQLICLRVDKRMSVPKWIGDLSSLVELEIYHEVPDHMMIDGPPCVVGAEMYHGVANQCSAKQFVKELGNLTNLRVLKTAVELQNEGDGKVLLESLMNLHKIQSIDIVSAREFLQMDVVTTELSFAHSSSLRVLDLFNIEFPRLPAWINAQDLPKLCQLTVVVSYEDEQDLAILGKFRALRKLVLVIIRVHRLKLAVCPCDGFQKLRSLDLTVPLKFAPGTMPRLEYINVVIPVVELKDAGIGFAIGLENLTSLRSMEAKVDCVDAYPREVQEAEDALKHVVEAHPNHLIHDVRRIQEDKMRQEDGSPRFLNQWGYLILQAQSRDAEIVVQQDLYNALYNEAAEVARTLPNEHPSVAKVALLQKQIADPVDQVNDHYPTPDELMEKAEAQKQLLERYRVELERVAAIVEELKAAVSPQVEDDVMDKIHIDQEITQVVEGYEHNTKY